ncbi:MAG: DNA mismatch repair endonuclease MutL [Vampirovibrionales bacterium]|nr:DNA mismatch repair endonuclease MutL [Vampirovibrionales bacterium]
MSSAAPSTSKTTTSPTIRVLPSALVNKIAAGEVVERPASVVKELVENALDAGATKVDIQVQQGGRWLRIADNGHGMTAENAQRAFLNHATSKIMVDADLDTIGTFGFRGEALASIGAVSELTCQTRTADCDHGTQITLSATGEPAITPTGCAVGTVMTIANLFSTVPARLKFLKKAATELGHVEELVQRLALSHPNVQLTLTIDERVAVKTSGGGSLSATFGEVFHIKNPGGDFINVTLMDDGLNYGVSGLTSTPAVMKSQRNHMLTFVNQRAVKCSVMSKAMEAAYQSLLPPGKYPFSALFLTLPLSEVDVNVHPTKKEVRYAQPNVVFGLVKSAVRRALEAAGANTYFAPPVAALSESFVPGVLSASHFSSPTGYSAPSLFHSYPEPRSSTQHIQASIGLYQPANVSTEAPTATAPNGRPNVKVIGQLFNTYILLETPQGLMVVDQHIASERAWFERFKCAEEIEAPISQPLLASTPIILTPKETAIAAEHQSSFEALGFQFSLAVAENTLTLSAIPAVYGESAGSHESPQTWFAHVLNQFAQGDATELPLDDCLATMSCHRAVRAGDVLSHSDMEHVVADWLACTLPWTCPHGRPIAHTIKADELNRFFHRPSLPVSAR